MALLNGFSREEYPNGDSYEGRFKRGARHGAGTYYRQDGARYEGQFEEGMMEGEGTYYYMGDEEHEGQWHDSQRHGSGKFKYKDGSSYDGRWEADMRHGQGLMHYASGDIYAGSWEHDVRHGQGQMTFATGAQYTGAWEADQRHGDGSQKLQNGSTYEGAFAADIPRGHGTLYDVDEKSSYTGFFQGGLRHGVGKCDYQKTGEKFSGEWCQGARVKGVLFLSDGEVQNVGYLNDCLVRREKLDWRNQRQLLAEDRGEAPPQEEEPVAAVQDGGEVLSAAPHIGREAPPAEAVTVA